MNMIGEQWKSPNWHALHSESQNIKYNDLQQAGNMKRKTISENVDVEEETIQNLMYWRERKGFKKNEHSVSEVWVCERWMAGVTEDGNRGQENVVEE